MINLSVIVPVYNTKQYLVECVDSVLKQDVANIEIILVDDESPDNAGELCDDLAKKYKNIKVIHKKNQGLGPARNSGLDVAKGEYVAFLDSDDYISGNYYNKLIAKAEKLSADICFSLGFYQFGSDGNSLLRLEYLKDIVFKTNEECVAQMSRMISRSIEKEDGIFGSSCFSIYRLDFLNKHRLRFKSEREYISEDVWFNMDCFYVAKCICYCDVIGYNYRYNDQSLTRSYRESRFEQLVKFTNNLMIKCKEYNCKDYYDRICIYFWINFEKCINQEVRYNKGNRNENLKKICQHELSKEVINYLEGKSYPEGFHKLLCHLLNKGNYGIVTSLLKIYNVIKH